MILIATYKIDWIQPQKTVQWKKKKTKILLKVQFKMGKSGSLRLWFIVFMTSRRAAHQCTLWSSAYSLEAPCWMHFKIRIVHKRWTCFLMHSFEHLSFGIFGVKMRALVNSVMSNCCTECDSQLSRMCSVADGLETVAPL